MRPFSPSWVTVLTSEGDALRFLDDSRERAAAGAVELRVDRWARPPGAALLRRFRCPIILTWRRGAASTERERRDFLRRALDGGLGRSWVDLDFQDAHHGEIRRSPRGVGLIISRHLERARDDRALRAQLQDLARRPGVNAAKLVTPAAGMPGIRQALRLGRGRFHIPIAISAAGPEGLPTRLLGPAHGSAWSYGRLVGGAGSDSGQPATALVGERYGNPSRARIFFAVLGRDVRRSASPGYHNALLRGHGRDRELFFDLSLSTLDEVLTPDPELTLQGIAVTTPYKRWARAAVPPPEGGSDAPAWNTLRTDQRGAWEGHNTDGPALVALLAEAGLKQPVKVVILGGGGAALGSAWALRHAGFAPALLVRDPSADLVGFPRAGREDLREAVAIVNATGSARFAEDALPWDLADFRAARFAVDFTYAPPKTHFLKRFEARGVRCIDGVSLFAEQARRQAQLLYDLDVPHRASLELTTRALAVLEEDSPPN